MIAKQVPMKSVEKSDFAELVKYITNAQQKAERVGGVVETDILGRLLRACIGEHQVGMHRGVHREGEGRGLADGGELVLPLHGAH